MPKGLIIELEVPYFSSFRKPSSTSFLNTYPVVPFTTIRGLLSNALGLMRNDFLLHREISLGLTPLEYGERNQEFTKILKLTGKGRGQRGSSKSSFPSSPMYKEFLVGGKYKVYVSSENEGLLSSIKNKMNDPERPLYIGKSDDMVIIQNAKMIDINKDNTKITNSIVSEIIPDCSLIRLPLRFEGTDDLVYTDTVSLAKNFPQKLPEEKELWNFLGEWVELFE